MRRYIVKLHKGTASTKCSVAKHLTRITTEEVEHHWQTIAWLLLAKPKQCWRKWRKRPFKRFDPDHLKKLLKDTDLRIENLNVKNVSTIVFWRQGLSKNAEDSTYGGMPHQIYQRSTIIWTEQYTKDIVDKEQLNRSCSSSEWTSPTKKAVAWFKSIDCNRWRSNTKRSITKKCSMFMYSENITDSLHAIHG